MIAVSIEKAAKPWLPVPPQRAEAAATGIAAAPEASVEVERTRVGPRLIRMAEVDLRRPKSRTRSAATRAQAGQGLTQAALTVKGMEASGGHQRRDASSAVAGGKSIPRHQGRLPGDLP